jgi:hypothetical protein
VQAFHGLVQVRSAANAIVEPFWTRIQVELLDRRRWRTRIELANAIFQYIEIFTTASDDTAPSGWAPAPPREVAEEFNGLLRDPLARAIFSLTGGRMTMSYPFACQEVVKRRVGFRPHLGGGRRYLAEAR